MLVLPLRLLPSLLAGLLVFELVNMLTPKLQHLIAGQRARWVAVALLGAVVSVFIAACRSVTGRQVYGDSGL